ncbi:methionine ABC transporter substrate-binding protein [Aerococcus urinaehominis]|uniref:Lipoprotein n=1 Tax=Aerococcus urinaehominis TaxID=128944 RepID=A0A109RGZ8_9LACT|nr:MetQ/NlpA family ABC transporter substrate-binding protein [Aerococcus urinaehominis]AMB99624.1 methionine ABC transporter substrate-binding protein [Aerococcus urinaehominis]SDL87833.1 D-methionine transport system substrate-binding protein [Aerococcus urinaehominis]
MKKWQKIILTGFAALGLVACGNKDAVDNEDNNQVKVGVVGDVEREVWEDVAERAKNQGIDLQVEVFADYVQPNEALADGSLDINAFQHQAFLADFVTNKGADLVPIGYTYISPMAAYSNNIKDLAEINQGAKVVIPNDATNGGRALLLLQQAGLIKLDDTAGLTPALSDIVENSKNLNIIEVDAAQVPRSLEDAEVVIANTNFAVDAGLNPFKDGIFVDTDDLSQVVQYRCVIASRTEDAENEKLKQVVALYQSPETEAKIKEVTNNADQKAWSDRDDAQADFQNILSQVKK